MIHIWQKRTCQSIPSEEIPERRHVLDFYYLHLPLREPAFSDGWVSRDSRFCIYNNSEAAEIHLDEKNQHTLGVAPEIFNKITEFLSYKELAAVAASSHHFSEVHRLLRKCRHELFASCKDGLHLTHVKIPPHLLTHYMQKVKSEDLNDKMKFINLLYDLMPKVNAVDKQMFAVCAIKVFKTQRVEYRFTPGRMREEVINLLTNRKKVVQLIKNIYDIHMLQQNKK